ncbi:MAG: HEAT repeat domain-containing protein [Thermoanaerobaculia bacterium]|nr:HEAT repeat domain-containing protein [Thermoanaerobaculia bacterium]
MTQGSWEESLELLNHLPALPTEERAAAIETLLRNPQPVIRERALRTGAAVISDERLESFLREEADDVLRNAGLEMLKLRGSRGISLAIRLLHDDDPDVALQAVLVLGHIRDLRALEPLRGALFHPDINVVQAAIEAVGRLGDCRALPDLLPFLQQDPWLQMATIQALGDLRANEGIAPLGELLTDLMSGELAADAIARTGGLEALEVLSDHWLRFREDLDAETSLGFLAHVLEGLPVVPEVSAELLDSLAEILVSESSGAAQNAARALLVLGPTAHDELALDRQLENDPDGAVLPACLARRPDLLTSLFARSEAAHGWGFRLCARYPAIADPGVMASAAETLEASEWMTRVALPALSLLHDERIAMALLKNYREADADGRSHLAPLLQTQVQFLNDKALGSCGMSPEDTWVLQARLLRPAEGLLRGLQEMAGDAERQACLEQVNDHEELFRQLPLEEWLDRSPKEFGGLAARVAGRYGIRSLVPRLRHLLSQHPEPDLIRVVGELRDPESLPILIRDLETAPVRLHPLILESLGRIGGPEARAVLRRCISEGGVEPRIGYRALSLCATEDDDAIFRAAVGHPDWYVRLASVEVLGRFGRPENLAALSQLAADSVGVVAQRAIASLERQ